MSLVTAVIAGFCIVVCTAVIAVAIASFIIHIIEESEW